MLKQRGGYWHVEIPVRGQKPIRKTTGIKVEGDKAAAQEYHDKLAHESWRVSRLGEKPRKTWEEAVVQWRKEVKKKSLQDDLERLKWLDKHLSGKYLDEITRSFWNDVLADLEKERGVSPNTQNHYTALVRSIMRKAAHEWEWGTPVPKLFLHVLPEPEIRPLTIPEAKGFYQDLPGWARDVFLFDLATGLRKGNLLGLQWPWVSLEGRLVEIPGEHTKNGKKAYIVLNDMAVSILERQVGKHDDYVFVRDGEPISIDCWRWHWDKARAGRKELKFHNVRKSFASWLRSQGVPLENIKDAGQWLSLEVVESTYAGVDREVIRRDVAKLMPLLTQVTHTPADAFVVSASAESEIRTHTS